MLSIHRYIGISHPKLARAVCSYRAVTKGIFCIFVLLIIFIFSQLIFEKMEKVIVIGKKILDKTCWNQNSKISIYYTPTIDGILLVPVCSISVKVPGQR
jgi:hypothetical protein